MKKEDKSAIYVWEQLIEIHKVEIAKRMELIRLLEAGIKMIKKSYIKK